MAAVAFFAVVAFGLYRVIQPSVPEGMTPDEYNQYFRQSIMGMK